MKNLLKKLEKKILLILLIIVLITMSLDFVTKVKISQISWNQTKLEIKVTEKKFEFDSDKFTFKEFKSHCECRKEVIRLAKTDPNIFTIFKIENKVETVLYTISIDEFEKSTFTCDLFNELRRGKHQKVHSYSLYGPRNSFYYRLFVNNSRNLNKLYPGWIMRVSHDVSIDSTIICEAECVNDTYTGKYLDNIDFCDITKVPEKGLNESAVWSAFYMHPMKYRWLPSGDSFVDVFTSRDSDSFMIEREVHAVDEWFKSGKFAHVMRGKF